MTSFKHNARVLRAAEMASAQAGCSIEETLALMVGRAEVERVSIDEIAVAVLAGLIRFDT
jgi:hypothetical protein